MVLEQRSKVRFLWCDIFQKLCHSSLLVHWTWMLPSPSQTSIWRSQLQKFWQMATHKLLMNSPILHLTNDPRSNSQAFTHVQSEALYECLTLFPTKNCRNKPTHKSSQLPTEKSIMNGLTPHPTHKPLWMPTYMPAMEPTARPTKKPTFPHYKTYKKPMLKSLHTSIWKLLGVALYSGHKVIGCNGILVMSCCKVMKLHGDTKSLQEIKILTKLHGRFHNNQKCNVCGECC